MQPIWTIPLPGTVIQKLQEAGFHCVEDLFNKNNELQPDLLELLKPYQETCGNLAQLLESPVGQTAYSLLEKEVNCPRIITFSEDVDEILGGGVPLGSVLEVCGAPGSGKTQFCLQLCINVQVPTWMGGVDGEAVFIDTDSGFSPHRLTEMGQACKEHCCLVARVNSLSSENTDELQNLSFSNVHYFSACSYMTLLASVLYLPLFLLKHSKIKLIVIDSLAFPFLDVTNSLLRTQLLCRIVDQLNKLAEENNLAVVVTNQLTTRVTAKESQIVPALGESIGHMIPQRLMLGSMPNSSNLTAVLMKSSSLPNSGAHFEVRQEGIRDLS